MADLAGPRIYTLEELQRSHLTVVGKHRVRLPIRVPGKVGKAYRSGANLTLGAPTGSETCEQFLAAHTTSPKDAVPGNTAETPSVGLLACEAAEQGECRPAVSLSSEESR